MSPPGPLLEFTPWKQGYIAHIIRITEWPVEELGQTEHICEERKK